MMNWRDNEYYRIRTPKEMLLKAIINIPVLLIYVLIYLLFTPNNNITHTGGRSQVILGEATKIYASDYE